MCSVEFHFQKWRMGCEEWVWGREPLLPNLGGHTSTSTQKRRGAGGEVIRMGIFAARWGENGGGTEVLYIGFLGSSVAVNILLKSFLVMFVTSYLLRILVLA